MARIKNRTRKRFIGDVGEAVAARFLEKRGFSVVGKNYLKKWGEIDIIAKKGSILHFVEVKTVSREIFSSVSRETDIYNPAENVHQRKLKRIFRSVETYLAENNVSRETNWQIDVITVKLDLDSKKAKVDFIENIVV